MIGKEFPHPEDRNTVTYTILENTQNKVKTLKKIVYDEVARQSLMQSFGISTFRHKLQWRWLVARVLVYLEAHELALYSSVCKRWDGLIFTTAKWNGRDSQTDASCVSIFREVLRLEDCLLEGVKNSGCMSCHQESLEDGEDRQETE